MDFDGFNMDFDTHIMTPIINGMFAAIIEQEQGLDAWSCFS